MKINRKSSAYSVKRKVSTARPEVNSEQKPVIQPPVSKNKDRQNQVVHIDDYA